MSEASECSLEEARLLRTQIQEKDALIETMKNKTKEFVSKIKLDHAKALSESEEKWTKIQQVIVFILCILIKCKSFYF